MFFLVRFYGGKPFKCEVLRVGKRSIAEKTTLDQAGTTLALPDTAGETGS